MSDLTPLLILVAAGFAALFMLLKRNDNGHAQQPIPMHMQQMPPPQWMQPPQMQMQQPAAPSAEMRAMQDTIKMLVESQTRAQMQQSQQRSYGASAAANTRMRSNSSDDDAPAPELASRDRLQRAPSVSGSGSSSSSSSSAVPFELLQDMKALQDSIKNLERKNRELNRQLTLTEVSNVVDVERKYRIPIPVLNPDAGASAVQGIQQLNLSASEIETIRAIFNMFDVHQTGQISTRELSALHKQLGEPLTDDEANAAVSELDQEGTGSVNFNKFLIWWYHQHTGGRKGSAYTQRFKLMHAKLTTNEFDVNKVITQDSGEVYTLEYRLNFYYKSAGSLKPISPWHDIPLNRLGTGEQGQLFNFVCEIPKWTRAKFECATGELYNPIKQDTQHGKLRYYKHGDMMFNYGFFPQTWEDPDVIPTDTKCPGDNDPIDCVEIGATQIRVGAIAAVKVLGLLGLIDDGETDWKIIAVSISDPMAHLLNDVDDVELHLPGAIKAIREYFRDYKSYSGKINTYALRAQAMPRHYAIKVLEETHQHWKSLHLVKKRDTIGESSAQAELRMRAVAGSPASSHAMPAAVPIPPHAQSLLQSAGSPIMRGNSMPASTSASSSIISSPRINGVVQPVGSLTGMEQPLDKLMAGK